MKRIFLTSLTALCLVFSGCDDENSPTVIAQNQKELISDGYLVGKLPDGREIRRYSISRGDRPSETVYVAGDATTTTAKVGKQNVITVFINGRESSLKEAVELEKK